ncbi:MAG: hypothetical protein ACP5FU_04080 [Nitrososphaeria archaeon]
MNTGTKSLRHEQRKFGEDLKARTVIGLLTKPCKNFGLMIK